ncbi:uncharacterized protein DS421_11g322960 [Arachis hypogaea]|nr:uncharacterized protein DS421_11g322960 [Arachis hypogaea]
MLESFSDAAHKVVMAAQQEAKHLGHKYIGTEHILLGLLLEETGMAAKVLDSSGVDLGVAREQTENLSGRGGGCSGLICTELRFTADAKSVLELSIKQARHKGVQTPNKTPLDLHLKNNNIVWGENQMFSVW